MSLVGRGPPRPAAVVAALPSADPAMPLRAAGILRSELLEHSGRGRLDLSQNPLSSNSLDHNHEAPREKSVPACYRSSGTSDFRMILTEQLQGVTMPAVRNAVEAERQWRHADPADAVAVRHEVRNAVEAERQWRPMMRQSAKFWHILSGTRLKPKGNGDVLIPKLTATQSMAVRNAVEAERQWRHTTIYFYLNTIRRGQERG